MAVKISVILFMLFVKCQGGTDYWVDNKDAQLLVRKYLF